ncbi:hypothetical protein [Halobellus rubicundus]|uniref:DUF2238 domain-containing protein n=1 Tax=Halobellus rubicundus TaxID=2996466 RepID=A0ABD5M980_9EURY
MRLPSRTTAARLAASAMRMTIAVVLGVGVATLNLGVVVNAVFALGVTYLPALLRRDWNLRLSPGLTLVVTLAVLLHTLGMIGLYENIVWYDHLTHTFSAALVAAVGYAATRAIDLHSEAVSFPPRFLSVFLLLFTLALGVFWEVVEFVGRLAADAAGAEAVLIQYGLEDTILDLVFDSVGALLVALFGTERLSDLVETIRERLLAANATDAE